MRQQVDSERAHDRDGQDCGESEVLAGDHTQQPGPARGPPEEHRKHDEGIDVRHREQPYRLSVQPDAQPALHGATHAETCASPCGQQYFNDLPGREAAESLRLAVETTPSSSSRTREAAHGQGRFAFMPSGLRRPLASEGCQ